MARIILIAIVAGMIFVTSSVAVTADEQVRTPPKISIQLKTEPDDYIRQFMTLYLLLMFDWWGDQGAAAINRNVSIRVFGTVTNEFRLILIEVELPESDGTPEKFIAAGLRTPPQASFRQRHAEATAANVIKALLKRAMPEKK